MSTSASFPVVKLTHDPLTKLDSVQDPTAEAIRLLRREIYANAREVPCQMAGGHHGHLGLVMPAEEYIALAGEPYRLPDPPDIPDYAGAANDDERAEWAALYQLDTRIYNESHGMNMQLKNLLLQAVPHEYLDSLYDDTHGFAEASILDMLDLLMDTYGDIDDDALEDNLKKITAPWDPTTKIITVFTNGNRCRKFATEGGEPIADSKYMRMLLQVFTESGVFGRAIEDWDAKPRAEKTVANLQRHFTEANKLRRKKEDSLKGALTANSAITNGNNRAEQCYYCWTHGVCDHSSSNCTKPAEGHVKNATLANLKAHGGSTWIQRPSGFKPVYRPPRQPNSRQRTGNRNNNSENQAPAAPST